MKGQHTHINSVNGQVHTGSGNINNYIQKIINVFHPMPGDEGARNILLERVKRICTDYLKSLLHNEVLLQLDMHTQPDKVPNPWSIQIQEFEHHKSVSIPYDKPLLDIFNEMGKSMLILGEPGAGKTTTLLTIAHDAINRSKEDPELPIPVFLNLSSWSERQLSLSDWIIEELTGSKYSISKKFVQEWVEHDTLFLFLDGLDEVQEETRNACVRSINAFRQEHGLTPIIVCSRTEDYNHLPTQLSFQTAIQIQPLTKKQINAYLTEFGEEVSALKTAIKEDLTLQELATSPLMLNMMLVVYHGEAPESAYSSETADKTAAERQEQLFDLYVDKCLHRRGKHTQYKDQQVLHYLSWLARRMCQNFQTEFFVEDLQPTWLIARKERIIYRVSVSLLIVMMLVMSGGVHTIFFGTFPVNALIAGFMLGLLWGLIHIESGAAFIFFFLLMKGVIEVIGFEKTIVGFKFLLGGFLLVVFSFLIGHWGSVYILIKNRKLFNTFDSIVSAFFHLVLSIITPIIGIVIGILLWKSGSIVLIKIIGLLNNASSRDLTIGLISGLVCGAIILKSDISNSKKKIAFSWTKDIKIILLFPFVVIIAAIITITISLASLTITGIIIGGTLEALKVQIDGVMMLAVSVGVIAFLLLVMEILEFGRQERFKENLMTLLVGIFSAMFISFLVWFVGKKLVIPMYFQFASYVVFLETIDQVIIKWTGVTPIGKIFDMRGGIEFGLYLGIRLGLILFGTVSLPVVLSFLLTQKEETKLFNQVIWNAFQRGIVVGLTILAIGGGSVIFFIGIAPELTFTVFLAILTGLASGGLTYIQHITLRLILNFKNSIPFNFVKFLDYSTERILLHKVGGGYKFIHRLLLEYFALMEKESFFKELEILAEGTTRTPDIESQPPVDDRLNIWTPQLWLFFNEQIWKQLSRQEQNQLLRQCPQSENVLSALSSALSGEKQQTNRPNLGFIVAACQVTGKMTLLDQLIDMEWLREGFKNLDLLDSPMNLGWLEDKMKSRPKNFLEKLENEQLDILTQDRHGLGIGWSDLPIQGVLREHSHITDKQSDELEYAIAVSPSLTAEEKQMLLDRYTTDKQQQKIKHYTRVTAEEIQKNLNEFKNERIVFVLEVIANKKPRIEKQQEIAELALKTKQEWLALSSLRDYKQKVWEAIHWQLFRQRVWQQLTIEQQKELLTQFFPSQDIQNALTGIDILTRPRLGFIIAACQIKKQTDILICFINFTWWESKVSEHEFFLQNLIHEHLELLNQDQHNWGISWSSLPDTEFLTSHPSVSDELSREIEYGLGISISFSIEEKRNLIGRYHKLSPDEIQDIWYNVQKEQLKCAVMRPSKQAELEKRAQKAKKEWSSLVLSKIKQKKNNDTIQEYQQLLSFKPDDYQIWKDLGGVYYYQGEYEKSLEASQKAIDLKPDYYQAWHNLGLVYYAKKEYQKAIHFYQRSLEFNPNFGLSWHHLGNSYYRQQQYKQAIQAYQKALKCESDDPHLIWMRLGQTYYAQEHYNRAIQAYQTSLEIKPDNSRSLFHIGNVYFVKQQYDKAIQTYQHALKLEEGPGVWRNLALAYHSQQNYDKAIQAYQNTIVFEPDNDFILYNIACCYAIKSDIEKTFEFLHQAIELNPEYRERAKTESDFAILHNDSRYRSLLYSTRLIS